MSLRQDPDIAELRQRIRHSTAHVMADVVTQMFPEAKLAIGPPTEDGFYYDFLAPEPFREEDLERIERQMKAVIAKDLTFEYSEYARDEALELNADEPLKLEIINAIPKDEAISTYRHGGFEDLCAGPHVASTGKIPAFKLLSVAGAYWRGDEKRPMLQRIYGTAFESQEELDEHLRRLDEARRRDHRLLGRELDLFSMHDETGPGLIVWHPKGARLRSIVEDFWKQEHYNAGYDLVYTPHIGRSTLWETSGHLDFYQENMYAAMEMDGQNYYLKPMNCPFHIMYYRTAMRSYRDLPMRIGELGSVYRYERGGVLHGLLRVRGMTQDDAHIFCRPDQVVEEVNGVLDLDFHLLEAMGFSEFEVMLSTRPEKAVGAPDQWELATNSLRRTLERRGIPFEVDEGGGAFYGPKIDVHIRDAIGRLWQCTTVQFDFNLPERFGSDLHRRGRPRAPAIHGSPRAARLARALCRCAHRALRRRISGLARSGAGGRHPHRRPSYPIRGFGVRTAGGCRHPLTRRRAQRAHERQDPRGADPEDTLHARSGRPRSCGRRRSRPTAFRRKSRRSASRGHRGAHSEGGCGA